MYQAIWGTSDWNIVVKDTIEKKPEEIVARADLETKLPPKSNKDFPRSIRSRLAEINQKKKDEIEKYENSQKFLKALHKSYNELEPADRLEIYESDHMVKIITDYQWQKMDTLWFQQNRGSHPCMRKPFKDPEIEADLKVLVDTLAQPSQQQPAQGRNIPNSSANLFRIQS